MRLQVIQDSKGKEAGVFIPIEDWTLIKSNYPDVENLEDIPAWQQNLVKQRIEEMSKNPASVSPIQDLLDEFE
jgi:hypothetical protein